jgi:hypothetical protein
MQVEMEGIKNFSYRREESRVCQYNVAVTTPYMVQKGVVLSSLPDDIVKLEDFQDISGEHILEGASLTPIYARTSNDTAEILKETFDTYTIKADDQVMNVTKDTSKLALIVHKVPAQEIYYIDADIVLDYQDAEKPFNGGVPTTLLVDGNRTITIR